MDISGWDWAKIAAAGAIVWKVGIFIYKKMIKPVIGFIKEHDLEIKKLNYIADELQYNGGKTTKDVIRKTSNTLESINNSLLNLVSRYDFYFDLSEDALFECNSEGECTRANISLCNMFGATKEQMYGFGWTNYIEQTSQSKARFINALESDSEITDNYTIKNGNKKATYTALIHRDTTGEVLNVMGRVFLI